MGKASRGRDTKPSKEEETLRTLGFGGKKSTEQMRFERATKEAVQTLARRGMPLQDLAGAIRRCLNNMHGPEWHCLVGEVKAFSVHVRYWRGKSFLFIGSGLRIIIFQSAPPPAGGGLPPAQAQAAAVDSVSAGEKKGADRMSIKVLRSEMEPAYQKRVLAMASAAAKGLGKDADLDSIVSAIKVSLTDSTGPVWHVVGTTGKEEWSFSVAHEPGQLLHFQMNGDRIVIWKHAQPPPGLADLFTTKRVAFWLFMATMVLLCLYIKVQSSCEVCCSSHSARRLKARCEGSDAEGGVADLGESCPDGSTDEADRCLQIATAVFYSTCGTLAIATSLKWSDRTKFKHKMG